MTDDEFAEQISDFVGSLAVETGRLIWQIFHDTRVYTEDDIYKAWKDLSLRFCEIMKER